MTATLEEIHRDPTILDRAIEQHETLEITNGGKVTAMLLPRVYRKNPDFVARAKEIWGENPPGEPLSEIVSDMRD
jgi:hypothetical protein